MNWSTIRRAATNPIPLPGIGHNRRATIAHVVEPLPDPLRETVRQVARRTRLWRSEKLDVARELVSHFHEGLACLESEGITGDAATDRLITEFGPIKPAAKLIRRAKLRCRPLWWKFQHRTQQAFGLFILLLTAYAGWIMTGRPKVRVDYVARLNEPLRSIPEQDRAWPLYEKAIAAYAAPPDELAASGGISWKMARTRPADDAALAAWLQANEVAISSFVAATTRPVYGRAYEADTKVSETYWAGSDDPPSLIAVTMPHLSPLRQLCVAAMLRARLRAAGGDLDGAWADLLAVSRTANFLVRGQTMIEHFVGAGSLSMAEETARQLLRDGRGRVSADLLRAWAHAWSASVPGGVPLGQPLIERDFALDLIQRVFTEGTFGGGHVIPGRLGTVSRLIMATNGPKVEKSVTDLATAMLHVGRRETLAEFEQFWTISAEDIRRPLYDPRRGESDKWINQLVSERRGDLLDGLRRLRHALLLTFAPSLNRYDEHMRRTAADHDATLACLALAAWRATHNTYPAGLQALVPDFLPAVPADPYDGKPLKYKLAEDGGDFVLYSIAGDFRDDGGAGEHDWEAKPASPNPRPVDHVFWPPRP